jgi:predicted  nucleic acid-binding Zn-ribbon protein
MPSVESRLTLLERDVNILKASELDQDNSIRAGFRQVREDIGEIRDMFIAQRQETELLDDRSQKMETRVENIETRVENIETRVGKIEVRVTHTEEVVEEILTFLRHTLIGEIRAVVVEEIRNSKSTG